MGGGSAGPCAHASAWRGRGAASAGPTAAPKNVSLIEGYGLRMGITYAGTSNWEIAGLSTAPNHDHKRLCVRRKDGDDYHYKKTPLQKNIRTGEWEQANERAGGCIIPKFLPRSPSPNKNTARKANATNNSNRPAGAWQRIVRAVGTGKDRMNAVGRAHDLGHTTEAMRILMGDTSLNYRDYLPRRRGPHAGQHPPRAAAAQTKARRDRDEPSKLAQEAKGFIEWMLPRRGGKQVPMPSPNKNNNKMSDTSELDAILRRMIDTDSNFRAKLKSHAVGS